MKKYAVSYIIGSVMIAAAFITLFTDFSPGPVKSKNASWILFLGGAAFVIAGSRDYNEGLKKEKKDK
ncbi:MAG: hypothetical protein WDO16_22540 [Bacteroidota bacterium]